MSQKVFVYDPTASDKLSSVRGIGRYLQILKENFSNQWIFSSNLPPTTYPLQPIFINPFFNFLQLPLTFKRISHRQIAVIHDLIPLKYPSHFPPGIRGSIYILLNKLALKNYDLIITDSEASKADIIKILGIREDRIRVIYPCLPKVFLNAQYVIRNQKINKLKNGELRITNYCLYVGDATWNKNLVNLARAIKIANVNCVFVGKVFQRSQMTENRTSDRSEYRWSDSVISPQSSDIRFQSSDLSEKNNVWQHELKEFFELVKDDKRFIFAGFVPDSELIKLYQRALFNILPSRDEGFGFSYLEAANFGCPSLLSDIPVLREISGGKAIFFDPNNPQDIAEKITGFLSKNVGNDPRVFPNKETKKRSEFFSREKFKQEFLSVI